MDGEAAAQRFLSGPEENKRICAVVVRDYAFDV